MSIKRILLINYYWPPCGGSAVQRWVDLVKNFNHLGLCADVITINEDKATYPLLDQSLLSEIPSSTTVYKTDSAELFFLYNQLKGSSPKSSAQMATNTSKGFLDKVARFVRGNFFLPDPRKGWNKYALKQAEHLLQTQKYDVVFTAGPPQSSHLIGRRLKQKFPQLFWVADFHDYWTDNFNLKTFYRTAIAQQIDLGFEKKVIRHADAVLTHCLSSKKLLSKRYKDAASKMEVLTMGYEEIEFEDGIKTQPGDSFTIAYTGILTPLYEAEFFLKVLSSLVAQSPERSIRLKLAGTFHEGFFDAVQTLGLEKHVAYLGYLPHAASIELIKKSDALLLINPRVEHNERIVPGKLYEYLAAQKPIISISNRQSENETIINTCLAGKNFDWNQEKELLIFLQELLNGTALVSTTVLNNKEKIKQYGRKAEAEKLLKILNKKISANTETGLT